MIEVPTFALENGDHSAVTDRGSLLSSLRKGDVSEFEFCKQATQRGWRVRHMSGAEQNYDAIISREGARSLFVQVKRCAYLKDKNAYHVKNECGSGLYCNHAYDILAAHLADIDSWVFYTRSELGSRRKTTYTPTQMRNRSVGSNAPDARDPDNWELLDQVAAMYSQESLPLGQPLSHPPV